MSIEQKERMQQTINEEEQLVLETSRQLVNTWSDFLCQGSISFGILECVKKNHNDKKNKNGNETNSTIAEANEKANKNAHS